MEKQEWQVRINTIDRFLEAEVFIYSIEYEVGVFLEFKDSQVVFNHFKKEVGAHAQIRPAFVCSYPIAMAISKGFIAYANEQGFKNGAETFVKGKLEATEAHLSDMRKLVFEEKVEITNRREIKPIYESES